MSFGLDGQYVLLPNSSLEVSGYAPGHEFRIFARPLIGGCQITADYLESLEVTVAIANFDARDALKNHELRKFLSNFFEARAKLIRPTKIISAADKTYSATGPVTLSLGPNQTVVEVQLKGQPSVLTGQFRSSFSALGLKAPRLLLLRMKDQLDFRLQLASTRQSG